MRNTEWHVRFNVTSTIKDGFRVGELTVSADFDEGDEPTPDDYRTRVNAAFDVADDFCQTQNRMNSRLDGLASKTTTKETTS